MIFVDSSVWIDFFNGRKTIQTLLLLERADRERIVVGDLVVMEVLQGFGNERELVTAQEMFSKLKQVDVSNHALVIHAAVNYRMLRARGITIRKTIDTLIATRCIVEGWPLLYSDRDFDPFVAHLGLRSALG